MRYPLDSNVLLLYNTSNKTLLKGGEIINNWLVEKRRAKGFTQRDLSKKINVSREYISMLENGDRTPSVAVAKKISKELDFAWENFFNQKSNESLINKAS